MTNLQWKINKDETICGYLGSRLVAGIWRRKPKKGDETWLQAVVYGAYPDVWLKQKLFNNHEQVKEVKQWLSEQV